RHLQPALRADLRAGGAQRPTARRGAGYGRAVKAEPTAAAQDRDDPAPARADPAPAGPAQQVLALQRTVGNRAAMAALRIDRKVEVRDVGRGEASGFARVPEFIDRLNALSPALFWKLEGRELQFEQIPGLAANNFETQMMDLVNLEAVLPMRMTNRHGLLGDHASGFHDSVDGDTFTSGYVDIDDLLAGDDLGFQMLLVHFLTERAATRSYAR